VAIGSAAPAADELAPLPPAELVALAAAEDALCAMDEATDDAEAATLEADSDAPDTADEAEAPAPVTEV
jgi:hypothetical protein